MRDKTIERERKIGVAIRIMNGAFKHRFAEDASAEGIDEISIMNGWILGYLDYNKDRDVYQKTLETELGIGKSSVTSLVKLLEKNGLITRVEVPGDARLKKIVLTQKGTVTSRTIKATLDAMEFSMLKGIDENDLETFFRVSDQIRNNLCNKDCK